MPVIVTSEPRALWCAGGSSRRTIAALATDNEHGRSPSTTAIPGTSTSQQTASIGDLLGLRTAATRRAVIGGLIRAPIGAAVIVTGYYLSPLGVSTALELVVHVLVALLVLAVVVAWQVRGIVHSERPGIRAVEALAVVVTLMVCVFATAYLGMSERDPAAFSEPLGRTAALYFTMTTLTTIGFGDISAHTEAARVVVMLQMVFNVVVIGAGIKLIATTARHRMAAVHSR